MIAEEYPVDKLGIPLPVIIPPLSDSTVNKWNYHHAWYYERRFLNGTTAGTKSVRYSRRQFLPVLAHDAVHERFEGGAPVPTDENKEFKLTLFGFAGYVPTEGLMITEDETVRRKITFIERERLKRHKILVAEKSLESRQHVGGFMLDHVLKRGLNQLLVENEPLIYQFLGKPRNSREDYATEIVDKAAVVATQPLDKLYFHARRTRWLKDSAPCTAQQLVMERIIGFVDDLSDRVQATIEEQLIGKPAISELVSAVD